MTNAEREQHKRWIRNHPLYEVYEGIMKRTGAWKMKNKNVLKHYRDRGIDICKEWKESFSAFEEWGMKTGYVHGAGLSIDRIDNNKGYSPSNCRWATRKEQSRNKRDNIVVRCGDELLTLVELYERLDAVVPYTIFRYRIKSRWSIIDAAYVEKRKNTDPKFKRRNSHGK